MKKLILGIAMLFTGMSVFAQMYNTTAAILMTPVSDEIGQLVSIILTLTMFIIGIAGLVIAIKGSEEKQIYPKQNGDFHSAEDFLNKQ